MAPGTISLEKWSMITDPAHIIAKIIVTGEA
jgi:hypothetical protein